MMVVSFYYYYLFVALLCLWDLFYFICRTGVYETDFGFDV